MTQRFILHPDSTRPGVKANLIAFLERLPDNKAWKIEIGEHRRRRSDQQNRYLWGVCYPTILKQGGEHLRGWEPEDLHQYFLGEHFGWEELHGFGMRKLRPVRTSSKLDTKEFGEYVDFIQRKAAELGVYIPSPGEEVDT